MQIHSIEILTNWLTMQKQKNGLQTIGTDSKGSVSIRDYKLARPIALILGNEAKGISVALQRLCDYIVNIPLSGDVNSLNVSCAGSILLWEIYRDTLTSLSYAS